MSDELHQLLDIINAYAETKPAETKQIEMVCDLASWLRSHDTRLRAEARWPENTGMPWLGQISEDDAMVGAIKGHVDGAVVYLVDCIDSESPGTFAAWGYLPRS